MQDQHSPKKTSGKTSESNRRRFLQTAGTAASLAMVNPTLTVMGAEAKGANDRIGIGFIGTGGRCNAHMNYVLDLKKRGVLIEPVAVCDVYAPRLNAAVKKTGGKPYRNYEDLLADPNPA